MADRQPNCLQVDADFYFKIDDDVAVNVDALADYLDERRTQGNLYLVSVWMAGCGWSDRSHLWLVTLVRACTGRFFKAICVAPILARMLNAVLKSWRPRACQPFPRLCSAAACMLFVESLRCLIYGTWLPAGLHEVWSGAH